MGSDYTPQEWRTGDATTPVNGPRLTHIEEGLVDHKHAALNAGAHSFTLNSDGSITLPDGAAIWPVSGVPDDGDGANGDYAFSDNGTIYFKATGTWGPIGGGGSGLPAVGSLGGEYTFISGDITDPASWWGTQAIKIFQWTPTVSGTLVLQPPALEVDDGSPLPDGGTFWERDYYVWEGTVANTDYPDGTAASGSFPVPDLADAYWYNGLDGKGNTFSPDHLTVVAGTTYTVIAVDNDDVTAAGHKICLDQFFQSVQHLGGVTPLIPKPYGTPVVYGADGVDLGPVPFTGPGLFADSRGQGVATGDYATAEGLYTSATGEAAHAEGDNTIALGTDSHAEGNDTSALGEYSHAEGINTSATAEAAHAEGQGAQANANFTHAEGSGTQANAAVSHAEGNNTTAGGFAAHAEGNTTLANGAGSHAEGRESLAAFPGSHASSAGFITDPGDNQYQRVPLGHKITTDATQAIMGSGSSTLGDEDTGVALVGVFSDGVWAITGRVAAERTDTPGTVSFWTFKALCAAESSTLRLVGSSVAMEFQDAAASTWAVALDVNSNKFRVKVTGQAAKTIRWGAYLEMQEVH